ncbi:MAG TPA: DUF1648 domain-containing protein [Candidatus Elarobacter sp.]
MTDWRARGREVALLLVIAASAADVAALYPQLPPVIPTHFDAAGHVNGMGPKSTLWILPAMSLAIYVILTAVALVPPRYYNYPVRVTDANRERLYALAQQMLAMVKIFVVALFCALSYVVAQAALHGVFAGLWVVYACLAAVLITLAYYLTRMIAAR